MFGVGIERATFGSGNISNQVENYKTDPVFRTLRPYSCTTTSIAPRASGNVTRTDFSAAS